MNVKVILNPYANRWGAQARVAAIRELFALAGIRCDLQITTLPQEAIGVAEQAALAGYDAVVAAGGDGTVSEVVNGLIRAAGEGPTCPLGVLPIGTGNDFADMNGVPRSLEDAVTVIASGRLRTLDAGRVNDRYFDNNCAVAMEPMVTIENERMKRLSGNIRYIAALVKSLLKLKAWHMHIRWDDGEVEGPTLLLSVCNSPRTGGVFYMAPGALMDDGLFDFVFVPEIPKLKILAILPRLFKGTHISHPLVQHGRTRRLIIDSNPGTPIHADGEVIAYSERHVEYEVIPQKIRLLSPDGAAGSGDPAPPTGK